MWYTSSKNRLVEVFANTMKGRANTMKKKKRYLSREEIMAKLKQLAKKNEKGL
jgi:hypothetical protein